MTMFGNIAGLDINGNLAAMNLNGGIGDRKYLQISNAVANTISQGTWTIWDMSVNGVVDNNDIGATVDLSSSEWYLPDGDYMCIADVNCSCGFSGSNSQVIANFYLDGFVMTGSRQSFHRVSGDRAVLCEKITLTSSNAISLYGNVGTDCSGSDGSLNSCTVIIIEAVN